MKRRLSVMIVGAFLGVSAVAVTAAAITDTSTSGTVFDTYNSGIANMLHLGDGLFNNTGSTKGVTGTISLRSFSAGELADATVYVYGAAGTNCDIYRMPSNASTFQGWAMTATPIVGGTMFVKNDISVNTHTDTLSVYCNLANQARVAMFKVRAE